MYGLSFFMVGTLDKLNYDVYYAVLNAANYGVPQKRERIFFVCFRKNLGVDHFEFPKPVKLTKHLCDLLENDEKTNHLIIKRDDIRMKDNIVDHFSDKALRLGIVNKGGQGERIYSINGVAVTLSSYGGGIGVKTGLYLVGNNIRKLSPRECARLDGFPDTFVLPENKNVAYKQFGNSIVVDVLQYILYQIVSVI